MRKGKEVVISTSPNYSNHNSGVEDDEEEDGFDHSGNNKRFSSFPSFSSRNASSKYDFVKVSPPLFLLLKTKIKQTPPLI